MSAIDDFLAAQPGAQTQASAASAPQNVDALIARDSGSLAPAAGGSGTAAPQTAAGQPGGWRAPGGFMMGLGDIVRGGVGDIVHGLSWAADKIAPNSQFAQDARSALPQMQQTIDAQNQQYAAQRAANGQTGIDWARLGGNTVGSLPTMALGGDFAGAPLLGKLGIGALQGAAAGGLMPTTGDGGSFAQQKAMQLGAGGLLGAATPLAAAGARAAGQGLWNAVKPVVQPEQFVGNGLAGAMAPAEAATAAANIRGAQQFVPGSLPTTAQVGQTPVLVQTEKAAGNLPAFKTGMAQRAIENNDARWGALMGVAQDPAALDAATQARSAAVQPLYDAANMKTANVGKAFINFAQRPAVQDAMRQADLMARNEGIQLKWPTPQDRAIDGQALDYTNRALGDMIGAAQRSGNNQQARALTEAQSYLKSWTQSYIPEVRQAAQTYANMSVPINTMQVGQQIANGLGTRAMNAGGAPEIPLMPFRSALTSAMNSGDAAKYGIDANALNTLQGIGQDLQRATVSNSIKSPGSDTAYNLAANGWLARQLYGPTFGGAGNLGKAVGAIGATALGHPMVGLGILGGGNKIGQMVGSRLQDRLSGLLLNPDAALPYLDARAASASQQVPGALMQGLLKYGRPSVVNGLLGGVNDSRNK